MKDLHQMQRFPNITNELSLENMQTPGADLRPWPFFVFNEEHEGIMGEQRITQVLEGFKAVGFGGAYLHPRPGLITEYLSPRWFELIRHAIQECRRLGLIPALYDENSYPSGFAGGKVPALAPDSRSRCIVPVFGKGSAEARGALMSVHLWDGENAGPAVKADEIAADQEWVGFIQEDLFNHAFLAESSHVSLLDPLATATFLQETHARYRAELNHDEWSSLGAIFTDEPQLPGSDLGSCGLGLHCTPRLLAAFEKAYGYDLRERMVDLYFNTESSDVTRYDFYDLMHQMWVENWARPLKKWCSDNGLPLTGHYLEHDWPVPYSSPGHMHMLAYLDWPGTDFLECFELLGHTYNDPQGFGPAIPGQEPLALYYLRQTLSVANQYGRERVMNESWAAGGHDSTPSDWLRIGRFLVAHGVTHFVPAQTFLTICGTRKQDHPQFFSDQSPWFDYLKPLNDELARLCLLGRQGQPNNRVLLLDPLTTGFLRARKADALPAKVKPLPGTFDFLDDTLRSLLPLRHAATAFAQNLSDQLIDFDIGDEYIIEEEAFTRGGLFCVGKAEYEVVVWPPGMKNLRRETISKIETWLSSGGVLLGIQPTEITINGRSSQLLQEWNDQFGSSLRWFRTEGEVIDAILERVPPRLRFESAPSTGLATLYRRLPDGGEVHIIVNSHPEEELCAVPRFQEPAGEALVFDPASGAITRHCDGADLQIPPTESRVLLRGISLPTTPSHPPATIPIERIFLSANPIHPNVLVLDRCELEVNGRRHAAESVYSANRRYWTAHGIAANGWFMRVQHARNLVKRDPFFSHDSGGTILYRATISPGTSLEEIQLAVEKPEVWNVRVNGTLLSFEGAKKWRDPRIAMVPAGHLLKPGENEITLEGYPFQVRQEIDSIYLLGNFRVVPTRTGFMIDGPLRALKPGSWREQGLPFYDGAVDYTFRFPGSVESGVIEIPSAEWSGALIELRHGSRCEICYGPDVAFHLQATDGREFTLRVIGLPKNLLGPWHNHANPRKRAFAGAWTHETDDTPRPGSDYDLLDLGLFV
jgi:hypothetical protein